MCLYYNKQTTERLKKKILEYHGYITVYKLVAISDNGRIKAPYRNRVYDIKNRTIRSNRKSVELTQREKSSGKISRGIHVYLTKKAAQLCGSRWVIVHTTACIRDFVAAGGGRQAVFTKIKLNY